MSTGLSKKGKVLSAQTRAIVFNVLQFALREKTAKAVLVDLHKAMDRVAAMTGLCRDTLSKIKKEGSANGGVWETKVRKKRQKVITNPNEVDKINIINKMEEFHQRNEAVSLRKLLRELKQENNFSGGKSSLLIVLNSMGYKWEKNETNKKVLQKVTPVDPLHIKTKKMPNNSFSKTITPTCSKNNSIGEQSIEILRVPPDGSPQGPSQLHPPGQGPFIQRPLLLHAPHYIFNFKEL